MTAKADQLEATVRTNNAIAADQLSALEGIAS
jgi:hypothetical protein